MAWEARCSQSRTFRWAGALLVVVAVWGLSAARASHEGAPSALCEDTGFLVATTGTGRTLDLSASGLVQDGAVKGVLSRPVTVTVKDGAGMPVPSLRIWFTMDAVEGAGIVAGTSVARDLVVTTDSSGRAAAQVKLGKKLGVYAVAAVVLDEHGDELGRFQGCMTALDYRQLVFGLFGGLGLFLFGMKLMTDALQLLAGARMKRILEALTANRCMALAVGAGVTAVIQSSSATTVMLVGFLNAGLMQLEQAIPIVFGANIGTTITGQLVAFNMAAYSLPAIGVALMLIILGPKRRHKTYGYALMGFGLLFLGMTTMSDVFKPLRGSPLVAQAFLDFSSNPLYGFAAGVVMTCIPQSSSATVGLTIAMAGSGLLPFAAAVPIIFGDNVGTTITAVLASLNANLAARRAASVHVLFNLVGSALMLGSFVVTDGAGHPLYLVVIDYLTPGDVFVGQNVARHVANAHTVFNVFWAFAFLPFTGLFATMACRILPEGSATKQVTLLEEHLLETPVLAIRQSQRQLETMLRVCRGMLVDCMEGLLERDETRFATLKDREDEVDNLQHDVTKYLVKLSQRQLSKDAARQIPRILHSVNDAERVSDIVIHLQQACHTLLGNDVQLSDEALQEVRLLHQTVLAIVDGTLKTVAEGDRDAAFETRRLVSEVEEQARSGRRANIERLGKGSCDPTAGVVFLDLLADLSRVASHLDNVAEAVAVRKMMTD